MSENQEIITRLKRLEHILITECLEFRDKYTVWNLKRDLNKKFPLSKNERIKDPEQIMCSND